MAGYRSLASKVEFLNLSTFLVTGDVALGDSVTGSTPYASAGRMDLSADGTLLAVTTSTGFVLVQTPASSAQSGVNGLRYRP